MQTPKLVTRGRGAIENPAGRFEPMTVEADGDALDTLLTPDEAEHGCQRETEVYRDTSKSIIATNDSPDVGMEASVNPYRGCEHGCIYCFARPTHEYLGMSAGLDFESKIFAKPDAPRLLREQLMKPSWEPKVLMMSGVTDCYQPLERKMKLTRGCLEVLAEFRNPAALITKNHLITRDVDVFQDLAKYHCIAANLSITTLDPHLARIMEPRASQPKMRLKAVETLASAGIPVGIMIGPVLPGLTDNEVPAILKAAAEAGAVSAHYTMLRLPYGVKDLFTSWIEQHFPDKAQKVLNRVREVRGGKLNDANYGSRMVGQGIYAQQVAQMMALYKKRYGLYKGKQPLTTAHFRRPLAKGGQMALFD